MKFALIDKIDELEPNKSIRGTKSLALSEEYLRDHFPKFPVMPGVFMIEAMTQASAWLIRISENFAHSIVVLKGVKNVKFGQFLQPGQTLCVSAVIVKEEGNDVILKAEGTIEGQTRIRAQLIMTRYNLKDRNPKLAVFDPKIVNTLKEELSLIWQDYNNQ